MQHEKSKGSFIGEPITPKPGVFDTSAMATGAPGLPAEFTWRKKEYAVAEVLDTWKSTGPCASGGSEVYVRKHWFRIRTATHEVMTIYFNRQPPRGRGKSKNRWTLYTVEGQTD